MTVEQIVGLSLALVVMLVGVLGAVLPGLPGAPLILVAAVVHKLYFGPAGASGWVLAILAGLTALSVLLDYLASIYGAKRLGATWRGTVGAVVGLLIGVWFGLPGVLLGPFAGAVLFELAGGRSWTESGRAGLGAVLGLLVGALGKLACCLAMTGLFAVNVIARSVAAQ
jgi:uncharacterized protein YqgC (DUF456 family)